MIDSQASESRNLQQTMPELDIPGLKILKEIGRGGMARVYLAMQESLQRPVAVKLLKNPDTPGFHERFMNEGRYLAALSHSNIVEVYDVGESDGQYFIIMEYLPGGDLRQRIQQGMKPGLALKVAIRIALCLDYLHEKGMVHRDLKPSNILFRADNKPVITDFGIAKLLQDKGDLTMGGGILGSPSYLSPEQAGFASEVDGRSDLYSLGVILFEMLTGARPFKGENFAEIIMAHQREPIPELPEGQYQYQPMIDLLLAKDMEDRYQSGVEFVQEIRDLTTAEIHQLPINTQHLWGTSTTSQNNPAELATSGSQSGFLKKSLLWVSTLGLLLFPGMMPDKMHQQFMDEAQLFLQAGIPPEIGRYLVSSAKPVAAKARTKYTLGETKPQRAHQQLQQTSLSKIDRLLSLAYRRMDSLRLSLPKGDSAHDYFRQILKIDPDNKAAKAGIRQILRWYVDKAERALKDNQIQQAKRYIDRGLAINRTHSRLKTLRERIETPVVVDKKAFDPLNVLDF